MTPRSKFTENFAKLSPSQQRLLLDDPRLKVETKQVEKYYQRLSDFNFLLAKIKHPEYGIEALINDYKLLDSLEMIELSDRDRDADKALTLIKLALQKSAHIFTDDESQLPGQLLGRLLALLPPPYKYFWEYIPIIGKFLPKYTKKELPPKKQMPIIEKLLTEAKKYRERPWLRPLAANLTPAHHPLIRTFTGHSDFVTAVAVTPDGKYVVSGSFDHTLKVWNLETGQELHTLRRHSGSVRVVAVTHDGKYVVSGSFDHTLKVWN
ncbi:WD40 repeat domain-containing protein, partial [Dapis sp. BLCC M126]|uniref:WD40 repeat domain-containing protein n=1 Tax=Dapis sp. BLCC M126 TaxID=3400189 RepID=UPI003CEBDEFF